MLHRVVWAVPSEGQQNVLKQEEGRAWHMGSLQKAHSFPHPLQGNS